MVEPGRSPAASPSGWRWLASSRSSSREPSRSPAAAVLAAAGDTRDATSLLPVALLLQRRHWCAAAIPLLTWLSFDPAYPIVFGVALVGPILAQDRHRPW